MCACRIVFVLNPARGTGGLRRRDFLSLINDADDDDDDHGDDGDDGDDNDYDGGVRNDEDTKPDDSDADPGVTVSPIVASWQVCCALNRDC